MLNAKCWWGFSAFDNVKTPKVDILGTGVNFLLIQQISVSFRGKKSYEGFQLLFL